MLTLGSLSGEPNTQACAVDLGLPGVLPVLNEEVVRMAEKFGLAIGATVAPRFSVCAKKLFSGSFLFSPLAFRQRLYLRAFFKRRLKLAKIDECGSTFSKLSKYPLTLPNFFLRKALFAHSP